MAEHIIVVENRELTKITGVIDVISFDELSIVCETQKGAMILKGTNLHVGKLNLEIGELIIEGLIDSIIYEETGGFTKSKGSFLEKIFK